MTKSDDAKALLDNPWVNGLLIFALSIGVIFSLGVLVGYFSAADAGKMDAGAIALGAVLALIAGLCAWQLIVRLTRLLRRPVEPVAASQRKVRQIWIFMIGLGAMIGGAGGFMAAHSNEGGVRSTLLLLNGPGPLPPGFAALLLAGLALLTIATIVYLRLIDEHDLAAQEKASLVSVNLYVLLYLGWTISARGGLTGPIDHGIIFAIVVLTYCAIWLWRKYF